MTSARANWSEMGRVTAWLSMVFPGAGHAFAGEWRLGIKWFLLDAVQMASGIGVVVLVPRVEVPVLWSRVVLAVVLRIVAVALVLAMPRPTRSQWRAGLVFLGAALAVNGVTNFVVRGTLAEPFVMPSESMTPSLEARDQFLAFKVGPGAVVTRGSVVVYNDARGQRMVKRVVGLGGDVVQVEAGQLTVNQHLALVSMAAPGCFVERLDGHSFTACSRSLNGDGTWTVSEGFVFLVGDNRGSSLDSRFEGAVRRGDIVGVAHHVWLSVDGLRPRLERIGVSLD